jgi:putative DNA methylase
MDKYPKRLIEVDLPIKRISEHARKEKSINHGHISSMHIWWARRPLAACRAVLCASLWPDPADELCSKQFREKAKLTIRDFAKKNLKLASEESGKRYVQISKNENLLNDNIELRKALLDFIADFSNWKNSTKKEYLKASRALTKAAHETHGNILGTKPLVVDPFAGGGAIPLEALRVGADAFASDLNPVASLINKVLLEFLPKYGERLVSKIDKWGHWVKDKADKELNKFYPKDPDDGIPIAFLWARTVICEGPSCGTKIPLIGNFWLSKNKANSAALKIIKGKPGDVIKLAIVNKPAPKEVPKGLTSGNSVTCPYCNFTTRVNRVRSQLLERSGGSQDPFLLAVVVGYPTVRGKKFRLPTKKDVEISNLAKKPLQILSKLNLGHCSLVPDEPCPPEGALGFRFQKYGVTEWRHLYTHRQLLTLCTFSKIVSSKKLKEKLLEELDEDFTNVILTVLAIGVSRMNDRMCTLCRWRSDGNYVEAANGGQNKMPMLLDFAEANPFAGSSGDWIENLKWIIKVVNHIAESNIDKGTTQQLPAQNAVLPNEFADIFFTDPPYYNAFGYSDLSEFFYIWLKRTLPTGLNNMMESCPPKMEEAISIGKSLNDGRGKKDDVSYKKAMTTSFEVARRMIKANGIGAVVFANKSTSGWEAILESLLDSGWIATASWPIDTELQTRQRALGSAALNSSVHIVVRPGTNYGTSQIENIGDWRDILIELPNRIKEWMIHLTNEGVVGADAIFACIGPALEVFSRYSSVEKANGKKVQLKEFLEQVWATVAKEALNMIFEGADASGFEEDARLTAMWLWTLRTGIKDNGKSKDDEGKTKNITGYSLEFDAARKIAQGLGAHLENLGHLVETQGDKAILLSANARVRYLFGKDSEESPKGKKKKKSKQMKLDFADELKQIEEESAQWSGDLSGKPGTTVLDQLHQSMILFGAGRGEALRRFLIEDGVGRNPLYWRLAQALSALYPSGIDEKRWVDGVLARKKSLGF